MATKEMRTVCNRDCPDTCGLIVTVEDGRATMLDGDPGHPVTAGFICHRTRHFLGRQYSPERLTTPLLRKNGALVPVSWSEALDVASNELLRIRAESGPAAILHYRSGGSLGLLKSIVDYFFELIGPVTVKRGDICSGAGDEAQETDFGEEESHDIFDILNSKNILLWGKNPAVSNIHLVPLLKDARSRGARITLIDPVRHKTQSLADRTVQPQPGGDLALALGVSARLFERNLIDPGAPAYCDHFAEHRALALSKSVKEWADAADVEPDEIEAIADALAGRPCSIQVGWGMGRRMNGSAIVRALDALCALSGNIGISGGGVSFYYKRRGAFDTSFLSKSSARTLCEPLLGREIMKAADPPVRAVWVTAANPVDMLPDSAAVARALETRELVVVVDSFLTSTARRATLVLPTTTLLEDDDIVGAYGHHWLGASVPVVDRPVGVLSDLEIVQEVAKRIDAQSGNGAAGIYPRLAGGPVEWKKRVLRRIEPMGVTLERLAKESVRNPLVGEVLWPERRFKTASGKMNLIHEIPAPPPDEPGFPLWLFSNSTEKAQSAQWAGEHPEIVSARCHPDAAAGFHDGEVVVIESAIGRMRARLRFDDGQRTDVVIVPKGGHFDRDACANALVRARTTDAGEGAAYLDCRVRILPAGA